METSSKILHLIRLASTSLGSTGPLYRDLEGLDKDKMLKKLGLALSTIFEIDEAICKVQPELTTDQWKLISEDKDAFNAEFEKLVDAMEAEKKGDLNRAKLLFTQIESSSVIEDNRTRAQAGLYRINEKN